MSRTIIAYFDSVESAEQAARDLAQRVGGVRAEVLDARSAGDRRGGMFLPHEDAAALDEGVRRGGGIVRAEVPDDRFEAVADALEASGAVDLDARQAEWRKEGWTGAAPAPAASAPAASPPAAGGEVQRLGPATDEARIPIAEERLNVGKREVQHGRVRVRSYVVETPVQEQVRLRQEHVEVERRPVDRPVTGAAEEALFRERAVEATESAEEAVVAKEARVVEELVVRKRAEERVQTVQDTVRRTEVEIEDGRTAAGSSTAADPTRPGTKTGRDPGAV